MLFNQKKKYGDYKQKRFTLKNIINKRIRKSYMSSKEFEINGTEYKIVLTDQVIGHVNNLKNLYNAAYEDPESFEDVSSEISTTINEIAGTVEPPAEDSDLDGLIQVIIKAVENKATQIENELKEKPIKKAKSKK